MFLAGKKTKEFYIDLQSNRYYSPGETLRGDVVLDLAKDTKINHIRVTLSGVVQVGANNLTLFSRDSQIAMAPDGSGNTHQLEAKSNRFPFEFSIPGTSAELPTSMKLTQQSGVRYTITASLKLPFTIVQSWSPQDTREISIVEKIDVSLPEYDVKARVDEQIRFQENNAGEKTSIVSMHIPKVAFVRGDYLPVTAIIKHYKFFEKKQAVTISLMRRFHLFNKGKTQLIEQRNVRKPRTYDLSMNVENDYKNEFMAKIFVPQSVPPSTASSGRILRVDYVAHIAVDFNKVNRDHPDYQQSHGVHMDIPVIIGTTPKAEVSIDSEDSEDEEEHVSDENPELSTGITNLKLDHDEDEGDHDGVTNDEKSPTSPRAPYLSRDNGTATRQSEQHPSYASRDNSIIVNNDKAPAFSPYSDHRQVSRNNSVASTISTHSRHSTSAAALSRDNSFASTTSSRKSGYAEPTSSLSRENSIASTASRRSMADVRDPHLSRNDSFVSTASNGSMSRRPTQDNFHHSRSNSQHSSSFQQQPPHPPPSQQQLQRDESLHTTTSHHTSSSSSSPYISPSTSATSSSTRNNSVRLSMPIAMPVAPPSRPHGMDDTYSQFPRQQSPNNMAMPLPMPMPQQQYHHAPPQKQFYSTSPNNYSSSPNNQHYLNQHHPSPQHHHQQPSTNYYPSPHHQDHPLPPNFDTNGNGMGMGMSMGMPMPMPGAPPPQQQWSQPPHQPSYHNNPPYSTNDTAPPPPPQYW